MTPKIWRFDSSSNWNNHFWQKWMFQVTGKDYSKNIRQKVSWWLAGWWFTIRIGSHWYERDHHVRALWIASSWPNLPMIPRTFQATDPLNGPRKNLSDTQLTERSGSVDWDLVPFDFWWNDAESYIDLKNHGGWTYSNLLTLNHQPTNYTWNQLIRRIRFSHSNSNKKMGNMGKTSSSYSHLHFLQ